MFFSKKESCSDVNLIVSYANTDNGQTTKYNEMKKVEQ